ncbi:MAG: hypothetical protein AAF570_19005 [Bacteroidota bacterium]
MTDIFALMGEFADAENQLTSTRFLAPCIPGSRLTTRVNAMVYTFRPTDKKFEGWGIWQPKDAKWASMDEEADFMTVDEYLELMPAVRLRLAFPMKGRTWMAFPANLSSAKQRFRLAQPVPVHLVENGAQFEQVVARWDGSTLWFQDVDRRADPEHMSVMQTALTEFNGSEDISFKGCTPEMQAAYSMVVFQKMMEEEQERQRAIRAKIRRHEREERERWFNKTRDERRLHKALESAGGTLSSYREREDTWLVNWKTSTGESHTSVISREDLTVVSSGICLSGYDQDFDLQSLVRVVEQRYEDW